MLLVPYTRTVEATDDQGRTQRRIDRGTYVVFAETGTADTNLDRHEPPPSASIAPPSTPRSPSLTRASRRPKRWQGVDRLYRFDWAQARIVMFVSDSRAIRNAAELRFADGTTATLEPISDLSLAAPAPDYYSRPGMFSAPAAPLPTNLQAFAAPAPLGSAPADFTRRNAP